jgi:putative capsular polysaccharide synthesis protein
MGTKIMIAQCKSYIKRRKLQLLAIKDIVLERLSGIKFLSLIFFFRKKSKDLILIYQVGKVASISIQNAIENLFDKEKADLFRIHYLTPESEAENKKIINDPGAVKASVHSANLFLKDYNRINGLLSDDNKKILIITGVRDVVSLSISGIFQNIESLFPAYKMFINNTKDATEIMQKIYFQLLNNDKLLDIRQKGTTFNQIIYFFDREIKYKFGIDIYKYSFNHKLGYQTINEGNVSIFIYKYEKLDQVFPKIEEFVKPYLNGKISLQHDNAGRDKEYSEIYENFKQKISFSKNEIDYCYKNKYTEQFYSKDEIKELYEKYCSSNVLL